MDSLFTIFPAAIVLWFLFAIALVVAPLFIWHYVRKMAGQLEEIGKLLRQGAGDSERDEVDDETVIECTWCHDNTRVSASGGLQHCQHCNRKIKVRTT